jgi:hypothetical protein
MIKTVGVLALMATAALAGNPVTINRDVKVTKSLTAESIAASNVNVTGTLMVGQDVSATRVKAALITADVVETGTLSPKAGDTIIIEGDLELSGATAQAGTSFLQAQEFIVGGNKQWRLIGHENFEKEVKGWNVDETSTCGTSDVFLGGHCKQTVMAKGAKKVFDNLPKHTEIRVKARVHFLDKWSVGDTAFAKVDGEYRWVDTPGANTGKINVCGSDAPEAALSQLVDIVMAHTASEVTVDFGALMSETDACRQSWGVDDVEIYVK